MATARSGALQALAQRIADGLPADAADAVVVTGSVSRGVADAGSDIELTSSASRRLPVFEALQRRIALRGERLQAWQERLGTYPEALPTALIEGAVADWSGYPVAIYTRQAWRDDPSALRRVSLEITDDILRLLFALNRRWEPAWKRLPYLLERLPAKPPRAAERLEAALSVDGRAAIRLLFEVARESVELVDGVDVGRAAAWLDDGLAALR